MFALRRNIKEDGKEKGSGIWRQNRNGGKKMNNGKGSKGKSWKNK